MPVLFLLSGYTSKGFYRGVQPFFGMALPTEERIAEEKDAAEGMARHDEGN